MKKLPPVRAGHGDFQRSNEGVRNGSPLAGTNSSNHAQLLNDLEPGLLLRFALAVGLQQRQCKISLNDDTELNFKRAKMIKFVLCILYHN